MSAIGLRLHGLLLDTIRLVEPQDAAEVLLIHELMGTVIRVALASKGTLAYVVSCTIEDVNGLERNHEVEHVVVLTFASWGSVLDYEIECAVSG